MRASTFASKITVDAIHIEFHISVVFHLTITALSYQLLNETSAYLLFAELYSLAGAGCLVSQQCHDVAVSALSLAPASAGVRSLATADRAGTVKVWQLVRAEDSDQLTLRCVFVSEVAEAVRRRPVLSLCHPGTVQYYTTCMLNC